MTLSHLRRRRLRLLVHTFRLSPFETTAIVYLAIADCAKFCANHLPPPAAFILALPAALTILSWRLSRMSWEERHEARRARLPWYIRRDRLRP